MKTKTTPEQICAAVREIGTADRALTVARDRKAPWSEVSKLKRELDATIGELNALQEAALQEFAKPRGYKFAPWGSTTYHRATKRLPKNGLPPWRDGEVIDHAQIAVAGRGSRPVALISHSYSTREQIERYAKERGLHAEVLPWSWWNPDNYIAVLFTSRDLTGRAA
jgi:hypothetical protein